MAKKLVAKIVATKSALATFFSKFTPVLIAIFGVNYKVRASALAFALITATVDYLVSGGVFTPALMVAVWLGVIRSFFQKSVGVSNAPNPTIEAKAVPDAKP